MTDKEILTNIIHNAQNKYLNLLKFESSLLADHLIANDVQIVRHGKWEYIGTDKHGNVFRCSYCALRIGLDYETTYCPHCGAKMDLEEENK